MNVLSIKIHNTAKNFKGNTVNCITKDVALNVASSHPRQLHSQVQCFNDYKEPVFIMKDNHCIKLSSETNISVSIATYG